LLGDIVIKDGRLITQIESGAIDELSAGYECEYEPDQHSPDIYHQVNLGGNHVAVVMKGRAGNAVKILDGEEEAVSETAPIEERVSIGTLQAITTWLRELGSHKTTDSDPDGAVERNERMNAKAQRRARMRNEDKDDSEEEMEKEEKEAKSSKKKSEDEDKDKEDKEWKKKTSDALDAIAKHLSKDSEKEGEKEKEDKEKMDDELIPVATLPADKRPKNPISGADAAMLDALKGIKSVVADSGDEVAKAAWNAAWQKANGRVSTSDGYKDIAHPKKHEGAQRSEELAGVRRGTQDSAVVSNDFVNVCRMYRGKNPSDAAIAVSEARKENK
jgi:hypothetical protein